MDTEAENRRQRILFVVPRISGGGAERVITQLASWMAEEDEYEVFLATTVRDEREEKYPLSSRVKRVSLTDRMEGKKSGWSRTLDRVMRIPKKALTVGRALAEKRKPPVIGGPKPAAGLSASAIDAYLERQLTATAGVLQEVKKELRIDVSVSFLNNANYINVKSKGTERTIVSIRSYADGPYAPNECCDPSGRRRIRESCLEADAVVAVSEEIRRNLPSAYGVPEEKIRVIYNPCGKPAPESSAEEPGVFPDSDFPEQAGFVFINTGRLTRKKGQVYLIRAFAKIAGKHPGAALVILGRPGRGGENMKDAIEKEIRRNHLENRVLLAGFKTDPGQYLARGDAYVMTSFNEGFPNALTEAMAFGLPVIAADCRSGPREILAPDTDCEKKTACLEKARYGILVPECGGQGEEQERQEGELARAMLCLIEQKELREEYARKSLERSGQFTKEEFLSRWKAVIEEYEP